DEYHLFLSLLPQHNRPSGCLESNRHYLPTHCSSPVGELSSLNRQLSPIPVHWKAHLYNNHSPSYWRANLWFQSHVNLIPPLLHKHSSMRRQTLPKKLVLMKIASFSSLKNKLKSVLILCQRQ